MSKVHHRKLPDHWEISNHWTIISGREPPDDFGFRSTNLQIIYNNALIPWKDESAHSHAESDEVYIVQEGVMVVEVEGERVEVKSGELLCVSAGTVHQLIEVNTPLKSFVIRSPSVNDKITENARAA